ncbi:MAG: hypothetical protein LBL94_01890 [Prevotellaceae bacterium]|jgi:hypothetical protein|nr:hypothetical protein [Prevotellaceae bacterium]
MELSLDINKRYSYADYYTWWDDKRRELVNGFIKMMSPAAVPQHQEVSGNLKVPVHIFSGMKINLADVFNSTFGSYIKC